MAFEGRCRQAHKLLLWLCLSKSKSTALMFVDSSTQATLRQLFPNSALYSAYGMSEACSSITFNTLYEPGGALS